MRASKWMTGVLAIGLIFGLMAVAAVAAKEPIKIGAIVELTGEAAEMGIENQYTIEVAESLLNAGGGIGPHPKNETISAGLRSSSSSSSRASWRNAASAAPRMNERVKLSMRTRRRMHESARAHNARHCRCR